MFKFNRGDTVKVISSWSTFKGRTGIVKNVYSNGCTVTFKEAPIFNDIEENDLGFANSELEFVHTAEDIEDFKNLIPMHIRMSAEEFAWFKAKIDAEDTESLPNLKALVKHPPKGAI